MQLTAHQQAMRAAKAHMDFHNLPDARKKTRAVRYQLVKVDANGRARSYSCRLYGPHDELLHSQYIGVFYEAVPQLVARRDCHVTIEQCGGGAPQYSRLAIDNDAPVAQLMALVGTDPEHTFDVMDSYVCGVRRVSFTTLDLRSFVVHLAMVR